MDSSNLLASWICLSGSLTSFALGLFIFSIHHHHYPYRGLVYQAGTCFYFTAIVAGDEFSLAYPLLLFFSFICSRARFSVKGNRRRIYVREYLRSGGWSSSSWSRAKISLSIGFIWSARSRGRVKKTYFYLGVLFRIGEEGEERWLGSWFGLEMAILGSGRRVFLFCSD